MTIQLKEITKDCLQLEIVSLRELGRFIFNEDIICLLRSENEKFEAISQSELRERWELRVNVNDFDYTIKEMRNRGVNVDVYSFDWGKIGSNY
jgi:hypothetical protein